MAVNEAYIIPKTANVFTSGKKYIEPKGKIGKSIRINP